MAARLLAESTPLKLITDEGVTLEFRLAYDTTETSDQHYVLVHCYIDGTLKGTPIRFKAAGNRIAADLPGVGAGAFITEDGHIANG